MTHGARTFCAVRILSFLAGLSMAAAASDPAAAQPGVANPRDAAAVFVSATEAGDADRIAALYAADAIMLAPGLAPIAGRDAIKATFVRNFGLGQNRIAFTSVRTETGSDRAATYWEWKSEITGQSGAVVKLNGRSLVYFKKEGDGWVISADMMHVAKAP